MAHTRGFLLAFPQYCYLYCCTSSGNITRKKHDNNREQDEMNQEEERGRGLDDLEEVKKGGMENNQQKNAQEAEIGRENIKDDDNWSNTSSWRKSKRGIRTSRSSNRALSSGQPPWSRTATLYPVILSLAQQVIEFMTNVLPSDVTPGQERSLLTSSRPNVKGTSMIEACVTKEQGGTSQASALNINKSSLLLWRPRAFVPSHQRERISSR